MATDSEHMADIVVDTGVAVLSIQDVLDAIDAAIAAGEASFSIAIPGISGPFHVQAAMIFVPGQTAGQVFIPGMQIGEIFTPGMLSGQLLDYEGTAL